MGVKTKKVKFCRLCKGKGFIVDKESDEIALMTEICRICFGSGKRIKNEQTN